MDCTDGESEAMGRSILWVSAVTDDAAAAAPSSSRAGDGEGGARFITRPLRRSDMAKQPMKGEKKKALFLKS